jgi:Domain of unknown function (DUF3786)
MIKDEKNNYNLCYETLCAEFEKYDPEEVARRSGAYYDSQKKQLTLIYFNREYLISYPEGTVTLKDTAKESSFKHENRKIIDKTTILSYLYRCTNSGLKNEWVPFRELEGVGYVYNGFALQGINKLVKYFGNKGDLLLKAGIRLGGKEIPFGDVAIEINVLPNVPMRFILWLADEEFEATASILYDSSAPKELHVEDLAGLCFMAVDEIIAAARKEK